MNSKVGFPDPNQSRASDPVPPPGAGGGEVDGEQEHEQQGTGQYSS